TRSSHSPAARSSPLPSGGPPGKSPDCRRAWPISTRHSNSPVISAAIRPAAVWMEKLSRSVQPRRRRYKSAWRAPFPDSSASDPSGWKMRRSATSARAPASKYLGGHVGGVAPRHIDDAYPGELAHPGQLPARIVAGTPLHAIDVVGEQLAKTERLAGRIGGSRRVRALHLGAHSVCEH